MTIARLNGIEVRILAMICEGCTNDQMAHKLGRSLSSIKKDVEHIMEKTQIHDRARLALFAVARGYAANPYCSVHIEEVSHYAGHD